MRRYTGNVTIELEDVNTGTVDTISETNMVTNVVNDLLGTNPLGLFYHTAGTYDTEMNWNDEMLPICPNMIGGILLFSSTLTEQAANLYPSSANLPVAYASNDVNATANVKRGSMNLTESMALSDGYKFVWEFTPSQGNGTIAAVGLTSKQGGANAYGSDVAVDTALLLLRQNSLDLTVEWLNTLFRTVEIDFENGLIYSIAYASNTVTITRYRIPVFDIGLNEKLNDTTLTLEDTTVLQCSTFRFYGSYTPYGIFLDGGDGYWYGFSNQANSSGSATMLWIKIKKSDLTFTEGSWTLSNATLKTVGSFRPDSSYPATQRNAVVRNGYLYVLAYDDGGVYKINLSNSTDVTLLSFGFTSEAKSICTSGSCEARLLMVKDLIIGYDFMIDANDNVIQTYGGTRTNNLATPLFCYKEFVMGWGGSYGNEYRYNYLLTPYLATISNLSQAVVKNADKTMKITYTLTEQVVSS
ncbi:MAG: hypothetical protein J6I76_17580 [Oribacterium sp.]|nr:hypothetical protein [Oribacterium sp.]